MGKGKGKGGKNKGKGKGKYGKLGKGQGQDTGKASPPAATAEWKCYWCQKPGHMKRDCKSFLAGKPKTPAAQAAASLEATQEGTPQNDWEQDGGSLEEEMKSLEIAGDDDMMPLDIDEGLCGACPDDDDDDEGIVFHRRCNRTCCRGGIDAVSGDEQEFTLDGYGGWEETGENDVDEIKASGGS